MLRLKQLFPLLLLVVAGCAVHTPQQAQQDLVAADKKCSSQKWPNQVSRANCLDAVETPIIKKDIPVALEAYENFASKRKFWLEQVDNEMFSASKKEAENKYKQGVNEAEAILIAHEPQWSVKNKNSILSKDTSMANPESVCSAGKYMGCVAILNCEYAIIRPIWKRDAPDTMKYYDIAQKKYVQFGSEYDKTAGVKVMAALDRAVKGIAQAKNEFLSDVRQAQIIAAQDQAQNEQVTESNESQVSVADVANLLVQGAMIAIGAHNGGTAGLNAEAAYLNGQAGLPPSPSTTQHTTCQKDSLTATVRCTTTSY